MYTPLLPDTRHPARESMHVYYKDRNKLTHSTYSLIGIGTAHHVIHGGASGYVHY
jgi:hypothetical protein